MSPTMDGATETHLTKPSLQTSPVQPYGSIAFYKTIANKNSKKGVKLA